MCRKLNTLIIILITMYLLYKYIFKYNILLQNIIIVEILRFLKGSIMRFFFFFF